METKGRSAARMLVVDDSDDTRSTIIAVLESLGVKADGARNAAEALRLCEPTCPYDVVLTDVVMPDLDGVQLTKLLAERYPKVPVILMTGRDSVIDRAVDIGAVALIKPFDVAQLWRILEERLKARR